ncbi:MAG: tetratricopeptide repeat protein, partial [Boseongicola sp.]
MRFCFVLTLAVSLTFSTGTGFADGNAGSYLAARTAIIDNNFSEAAKHFTRALVRDPQNAVLLENAMSAYLGLGDIDRAVPLARRMNEVGAPSQISSMVLLGDGARRGAWDRVIEDIDAGQTVGPLFDGLARAWAELGAGQMSTATTGFDEVISSNGVEAFGLYHKALALAAVGDFESAAEIFSGETGTTIRLTRRGVVAYAQVLSQLERNDDALELIQSSFGTSLDPALEALRMGLANDETLAFDAVRTPADGVAEIYHSIAGALRGEAQGAYTLLYSRMALAIRGDHIDALLMSAEILEELERYELATEVYDTVPRSSPAYHSAELGRAEALRRSGREDAAIEVLRQLTESHADIPLVHVTLGDTLRGLERFNEAIGPYNQALSLIDDPMDQHWIVFFARGIAHERTDQWEKAESDFRKALELRPEQPQVLNYLGYSFLEMQENLDEALDLIERAVALRPDSGYIIDSLGWGLYRLGRYGEAVSHMERAVEL